MPQRRKPTSIKEVTLDVATAVVLIAGAIAVSWLKQFSEKQSLALYDITMWLIGISELTLLFFFIAESIKALRFLIKELRNLFRDISPEIKYSQSLLKQLWHSGKNVHFHLDIRGLTKTFFWILLLEYAISFLLGRIYEIIDVSDGNASQIIGALVAHVVSFIFMFGAYVVKLGQGHSKKSWRYWVLQLPRVLLFLVGVIALGWAMNIAPSPLYSLPPLPLYFIRVPFGTYWFLRPLFRTLPSDYGFLMVGLILAIYLMGFVARTMAQLSDEQHL